MLSPLLRTTSICLGALLLTTGHLASSLTPSHDPHQHNRIKRIVGGQSVSISEAPFAVQLVLNESSFCSGSLIDSNKVITAGHCCLDGVDFIVYGTSRKYTSAYQSSYGSRLVHDTFKKVNVSRIIVHPQYSGGVSGNDIAILHLSRHILPDPTVRPIPLSTEEAHCNTPGVVYGYGHSAYTYSPSLQAMHTNIINSCRPSTVNRNFLITQAHERTVCNGDSGGSLVVDGKQIGIVSGMSREGCRPGDFNFFVKVANHLDFIHRHFPGIIFNLNSITRNILDDDYPSSGFVRKSCSFFQRFLFGC